MTKRQNKKNVLLVPHPAMPGVVAVQPSAIDQKFRFFYDKVAPWVKRGAVYAFPMHEETVQPTLLEGESAICALAAVGTGAAFGITSGRRAHAFYYHPSFYVVDLGILSETPVVGGAIVALPGDQVVGGWRGARGGGMFRHDASFEFGTGQEDFYARRDKIVPIPVPGKDGGVLALAYHPVEKCVFGITTGNLLIRLDDGRMRPKVAARLEGAPAPALVVLPDGRLIGAREEGRLWQYRPGARQVESLDAFAPCEKGKRYVAAVGSLVVAGGAVYGGTMEGGFLFSWNPATGRLVNLGKPHRQAFVSCLAEGHDSLIYGIVQEPRGLARIFTYDPSGGGFDDLGLLSAFITVPWTPHAIGAMCVGPSGEIYLGESDNISHLFVYHPPVVRR